MATCIRKVASESLEYQGEVEEKLKIHGGGMIRSRRLLRRRKMFSNAYT
jgi:hypothetical protein